MTKNTPKYLDAVRTSDLTKKIQFNPEFSSEIEHFFSMPKEKRIVLLHSVRGVGSEEPEFITKYIKEQQDLGNAVYIPKKFNFQKDETGGIAICNTMRYVIKESGMAAIGYNPDSEGTKFDYGITIFTHKPIKLLNPELNINDPIYNIMKQSSKNQISPIANVMQEYKHINENDTIPQAFLLAAWYGGIVMSDKIELELSYSPRPDKDGKPQSPALTPFSAVRLGMAYGSQKPFKIINLEDVKAQSDLEEKLGLFKSYSKVALKLHEIYNK